MRLLSDPVRGARTLVPATGDDAIERAADRAGLPPSLPQEDAAAVAAGLLQAGDETAEGVHAQPVVVIVAVTARLSPLITLASAFNTASKVMIPAAVVFIAVNRAPRWIAGKVAVTENVFEAV